jgi:Protein of unknown function (DUF998)
MTMATSSRSTAVALAWAAAATAVFYLVVLAVLHVLRTDVDPATDPVSDYAVGDYGMLEVFAMLAVGLGALALTAALHQTPRRSMVGLVLLAVFGLAKVAQAFFPIDVGDETTTSGSIHSVLGTMAFFALPVAAVLLSRSRGGVDGDCRVACRRHGRRVRQQHGGRRRHRPARVPGAVLDLGAGDRGPAGAAPAGP